MNGAELLSAVEVVDAPPGAEPAEAPVVAPSGDERVTPQWLFDALDAEFDFGLDAAATAANTKTPRYCGLDRPGPVYDANGHLWRHNVGDGLQVSWANALRIDRPPGASMAVWLNCPYSRGSIPRWCEKAEGEAQHGVTTVLLLPADTSTHYFHRYVLRHERRFLNRRLTFDGAPRDRQGRLGPAKFGSVIVIVRPTHRYWTWG